MERYSNAIKGLNHVAYRCRDAEETRKFYEDVLGLRLSSSLWLRSSKTGRELNALHIFFEMDDNSFVAFFELPDDHDEAMFEEKSDFDLHLALGVDDMDTLLAYKDRLTKAGYTVRGPADHDFLQSIYVHDPNGYVIELTVKTDQYERIMGDHVDNAHSILEEWQRSKQQAPAN